MSIPTIMSEKDHWYFLVELSEMENKDLLLETPTWSILSGYYTRL